MIISAFPGTGKSYIFNNQDNIPLVKDLTIGDSDSSTFGKDEFPRNYFNYITERSETCDIQFVSTHLAIRKMMLENNVEFWQVMPRKELKEDYINRYYQRGSSQTLIDFLSNNWDSFFDDGYCSPNIIFLEKGQFLLDVLDRIAFDDFRKYIPHKN